MTTLCAQWTKSNNFLLMFCFTVLPSCGGTLAQTSGEISSPLLPNPLPHDIECLWNIHVPRAIHMNVNVMVAWRRDDRCSNHISIVYTFDDNKRTVKICGREDLDGTSVIKSNKVRIKYHVQVNTLCQAATF